MSENETFSDFVKRQGTRAAVDDAYYSQQKKEWIEYLFQLYLEARTYLQQYIDAGSVKIDILSVILNEEGLGSYEAQGFKITIGTQQISFTPIGTLLIGSKGRVDVQGSRGIARLSLVNRKFSDARSMIKVSINIIKPGFTETAPKPEPEEPSEDIEWAWKIISAPPNIAFIDLTEESFLSMLQEVSGG